MARVKFIAKRLIQWIEGSSKMGIVFNNFLVYTDKTNEKGYLKILFGTTYMRLFAITKFWLVFKLMLFLWSTVLHDQLNH